MKLSKKDFCSSCLAIRHRMNDGNLGNSIEEWLDSKGYQTNAFVVINNMIKMQLEEDGGCPNCISLVKRAAQS